MAKRKKYDQWLLVAVIAILVIGIVMITSVGVPKSIQISAPDLKYPDCGDAAVDCYLILKNHVIRVLIGLAAMFVAFKLNYRLWKKFAFPFFTFAVGLLIYVLLAGDANNTIATSWINIPIIGSIQPSEIGKIGMILYLSYFFSSKISREKIEQWDEGLLKFTIISGAILLPVMLQPDYGSGLVLISIAAVIYFMAGANWKHIVLGAMVMIMVASFVVINPTGSDKIEHIGKRFTAFINPDVDCREGDCWQTRQANIAIGSGGFWGKGLTQGIQKSYWLPQASDDFIFAASAEELGFVRTLAVVLLYAFIAYRGFQIANHAPNKFAMLTAAGISAWVSAQAFLNIMVNTALFPVTGITLPFMSYGGSSMVTTLFAVGILLNISKYTTAYAYRPDRRRNSRTRRAKPGYRRRYRRAY